MIVKGKDFKDENWEDPSVAGWLMLFCIWLIFEIVMGVWYVYLLPYANALTKAIGYTTFLLPTYALTGVLMRFKDAVATSLVSLVIFLLNSIVNLIVFITVGEVSSAITVGVLGCMANICWIVYFCRSKLVSERFPKEERRIFAFDWLLIILSVTLCMIITISTFGNLAFYKSNSSEEYRETMEASKRLIGLNDHDVHFVDCTIDGRHCIVYFAADDSDVGKDAFEAMVTQSYFSDNLLFKMDKTAPEFIKSAIGDGLILVLNVFRKNVNDGVSFKITPLQIKNLEDPEPIPDLTAREMDEIGRDVVELVPPVRINGITMKSFEWLNEVTLALVFEVNEEKTPYINAYDDFKEYSEEVKDVLMMNRMHPALDGLWTREMSIKFILRGSRTGYSKEIHMF